MRLITVYELAAGAGSGEAGVGAIVVTGVTEGFTVTSGVAVVTGLGVAVGAGVDMIGVGVGVAVVVVLGVKVTLEISIFALVSWNVTTRRGESPDATAGTVIHSPSPFVGARGGLGLPA